MGYTYVSYAPRPNWACASYRVTLKYSQGILCITTHCFVWFPCGRSHRFLAPDPPNPLSILLSDPYIHGPKPVPQALRDVVLGTPDALEGLLLNIVQPATPSLQRNCVWALSNMCRGKPQPATNLLLPALPVLLNLLSSKDEEVRVVSADLRLSVCIGRGGCFLWFILFTNASVFSPPSAM